MSDPSPSTPNKFDNLTANFFDRIDKLRKPPAPPSTATSLPHNLFTNLAVSFNAAKARPSADQVSKSSLIVIDDAEFDDPEQETSFPSSSSIPQLPKSQSSSSQLNTASLTSDLVLPQGKAKKLSASSGSSLYKLGSQVFDDINQKYNLADEADSLKKRFLVRKKSIEVSIENLQAASGGGRSRMKQSVSSAGIQRGESVLKEDECVVSADNMAVEVEETATVTVMKEQGTDNTENADKNVQV